MMLEAHIGAVDAHRDGHGSAISRAPGRMKSPARSIWSPLASPCGFGTAHLWSAGDIIENDPALSRWHPDWADAFKRYMEE
jgi:hypothetical protein